MERIKYKIVKIIDRIVGTFHSTWDSICNLTKWFPIVWRDRDWDYSYLMGILSFKLSNMQKSLSNGNVDWDHTPQHREAMDALIECVNVLHRIAEDGYWETTKTFEEEEELIKADYDTVFDLLKKYVRFWWD